MLSEFVYMQQLTIQKQTDDAAVTILMVDQIYYTPQRSPKSLAGLLICLHLTDMLECRKSPIGPIPSGTPDQRAVLD